MVNIAICGINGKMGQVLVQCIREDADTSLAFGVDIFPDSHDNGVEVYKSIKDAPADRADVIIDFSRPAALKDNLDFAVSNKKAIVICTTGYSEEQKEMINEASAKTAVFFSANMSLGVNMQMKLIAQTAKMFADVADIEIIEKHHNKKVDAPSGTALMLADAINEVCGGRFTYKYGRAPQDGKREKNEIGIHSIRGGSIVGEHDVMFITDSEIITISHQAQSKQVFAAGAISAAKYISQKPAGFYNMKTMMG